MQIHSNTVKNSKIIGTFAQQYENQSYLAINLFQFSIIMVPAKEQNFHELMIKLVELEEKVKDSIYGNKVNKNDVENFIKETIPGVVFSMVKEKMIY